MGAGRIRDDVWGSDSMASSMVQSPSDHMFSQMKMVASKSARILIPLVETLQGFGYTRYTDNPFKAFLFVLKIDGDDIFAEILYTFILAQWPSAVMKYKIVVTAGLYDVPKAIFAQTFALR